MTNRPAKGLGLLRQNNKMLLPDPAEGVGSIILILRKPKLSLLGNNIKDLSSTR